MHHARRTLIATLLVAAFAATARAQPGIGTCVMGETRLATGGLNGLWTFGLRVYQWFDPATCGFCLAADGGPRSTFPFRIWNECGLHLGSRSVRGLGLGSTGR